MQIIIILIDIWGGRSAEIGGAENRVKHLSQASSILRQVIDIIDFTLMKRGVCRNKSGIPENFCGIDIYLSILCTKGVLKIIGIYRIIDREYLY